MSLRDLPTWIILQAHMQLAKREYQRRNDHNHAAGLLADMKNASKGDRLSPAKWQPYQLLDLDPNLTPILAKTTLELIESGKIHPGIQQILNRAKVLEQMKALCQSKK